MFKGKCFTEGWANIIYIINNQKLNIKTLPIYQILIQFFFNFKISKSVFSKLLFHIVFPVHLGINP